MNREPGGEEGMSRVKVVQMFTVEVNWAGRGNVGGRRGERGTEKTVPPVP